MMIAKSGSMIHPTFTPSCRVGSPLTPYRMHARYTFQRLALGALALASFSLSVAQESSRVRCKVKTNWEAPPFEDKGPSKVVPGDGGSVVMLVTKDGQQVIGGVPQGQLDWTLVAMATEGLTEIKKDKTKILWGEEGNVAIETIERFSSQFRVICSKPDPENAKLLILQQVLNPRSLTGKGAQLIMALPYDQLGKGSEYYQNNMAVGFTTTIGIDSTKLLLGLSPQSTTRSAGCPVFAIMLDKQMKPLWTNTLATESSAKRFNILSTQVDKNGAVWYLIKNITNTDPKAKEDLGYSFSIYRLDSAGQEATLLDLPGKEFAQDAVMQMLPSGGIEFAGIYANDKTTREESVGVFRCTFDPASMKFDQFKLIPFNKQIIKKEEAFQTNMRINRLMMKRDGGCYVVAERSGIETHFVSELSGKKVARTEQVNGPIHIFEITSSGDQKWYTTIDRMLAYENELPGTVIATAFDDALFIWFNDNETNIDKRKEGVAPYPVIQGKELIQVEFKGDGKPKEKRILAEGQYKQLGLHPTYLVRLGADRILTLGAEGFGKGKTWPILIEFGKDVKK